MEWKDRGEAEKGIINESFQIEEETQSMNAFPRQSSKLDSTFLT